MNLKDSNPAEEPLDVLQSLESAVVEVWRDHPEMNNYNVMRAYDAAFDFYRAVVRAQKPKAANLSGLDALLFENIKGICEFRLGQANQTGPSEAAPLSVEVLVACLRKLRKSVDLWTAQGGRQGYLQFIEQFL